MLKDKIITYSPSVKLLVISTDNLHVCCLKKYTDSEEFKNTADPQELKLEAQVSLYRSPDINKSS
jgi:hypothetical protein